MDLKKLTDRARRVIDKRGGTDALKQDAEELRDIAQSKGGAAGQGQARRRRDQAPGRRRARGAAPPHRRPGRLPPPPGA